MKRIVKFLAIAIALVSCSRDEEPIFTPKGEYEYGFFVLNEGNIGKNNGTLDFVSFGFGRTERDVYPNLGDTPQSGLRNGDDLYLVINYSNKIIKVNRNTLKKEAELTTELSNPRYMTIVNGYGYVTNWGDGMNKTDDYILVVDLKTLQPVKQIPVEEGPEKIFTFNNKVYALLQGGWGANNKIAVINPTTNTLEEHIETDYRPNGYLIDSNKVLITFGGEYSYPNQVVDGSIWTLTSSGLKKTYDWTNTTPNHKETIQEIVKVNNHYFFLVDSKLHKAPIGSDLTNSIKVDNRDFYHLSNLGNQFAVGLDAGDYQSSGTAVFFTENGIVNIGPIKVGINPNSII